MAEEAENRYAQWVGNTERTEEEIALAPVLGLAATLNDVKSSFRPGDPLPPLWQWLYFLPRVPQSAIGYDGHPQRGGFLPPVDLPRRMFAGARLRFHAPLVIGKLAVRDGTVLNITEKQGSSGSLVFVTVRYRLYQDQCLCVEEEQDIVYRGTGTPVAPPVPAPFPDLPAGTLSRIVEPDPVLLFRFSALTFNAHRIHYDRPYATEEEGYPGLVVQGPLTAIQLLELVRQNTIRPVHSFTFRGRAPLFDLAPYRLVGKWESEHRIDLEAQGPDGKTTMNAEAGLG